MKRSIPLRRTAFKRPERPERKAEGSPELARALACLLPKPAERPRAKVGALLSAEAPRSMPKTPDRVDQRIRESARGEDCTVRIPGVCRAHPDYTIWSHAPLGAAGKGGGLKALCLCGAYCCTACDAVIDGQAPLPGGYSRAMALNDWFMGHMRSLVRLRQKGLV